MPNFSYLLASRDIRDAIKCVFTPTRPICSDIEDSYLEFAMENIPHFEDLTYRSKYNILILHMINHIFVHANEPYDDKLFERARSKVSKIISNLESEDDIVCENDDLFRDIAHEFFDRI